MIKGLYVLFDIVANEGGNVFTAKNDEIAIRQVRNTFKESPIMNPKEYQLFKVGEYDCEMMSIDIMKKEINFIGVENVK